MRNKAQKANLSVHPIAGAHAVLLGMHLPKQKCPRLLGFALRRADHTEGEKYWLSGYKIFAGLEPSLRLSGSLFAPKGGIASDATFANFARGTMHLVKTKNRKARSTQTRRPYD